MKRLLMLSLIAVFAAGCNAWAIPRLKVMPEPAKVEGEMYCAAFANTGQCQLWVLVEGDS